MGYYVSQNKEGLPQISKVSINSQVFSMLQTIPNMLTIRNDNNCGSSRMDELVEIVKNIDENRPTSAKTEGGISSGNINLGFLKFKFAHTN